MKMSTFGQVIATVRSRKGMSLQVVADAAGITKTHVWQIEQGKTANPSMATICGLAKALSISPIKLCAAAIEDHE